MKLKKKLDRAYKQFKSYKWAYPNIRFEKQYKIEWLSVEYVITFANHNAMRFIHFYIPDSYFTKEIYNHPLIKLFR